MSYELIFVLKLAITAFVVILAAVVVDRSGPLVGGIVATLPLSAGPSYLFLATEFDAAFLRESSVNSLAVNAACAVFVLLYVNVVRRWGGLVSVLLGIGAWAAFAFLVLKGHPSFATGILMNLVAFLVAFVGTWATRRGSPQAPRSCATIGEWVVRGAFVTFLVALALLAARSLGAAVAGAIAVFPVVLTCLILVVQPRLGPEVMKGVLANGLPGIFGFSVGMCVLHATVMEIGSYAALALALVACVAWNIGMGMGLHALRQRISQA